MLENLNELKIYFFGTSIFAQNILAHLDEQGLRIAQVVTQPDRPAGRKQELQPSPVKILATERGLSVLQFEKLDEQTMEFFDKEKPDLIIVASYGLILPKRLIDLPRFGAINVHPSLLPELRGPTPIQTALWQGLSKTGTTIMLMDEKMDHGAILAQKEVPISPEDLYQSLEDKLAQTSNELLLPALQQWIAKKIEPREQEHEKATFTKMISKQDGKIFWSNTAQQIYNQYQALYLWPKVYTFWPETDPKKKERKLTIHTLDYDKTLDFPEKKLGQVFSDDQGRIAIQTEQGVILPQLVQLEGKNPTDIKNFVNGYPDFVGTILE